MQKPNFTNINIPKQTIQPATDYDKLLLKLIPNLKQYDNVCGGEGYAYFIDDKYIVKQYLLSELDSRYYFFKINFENFCKEIQHFANVGFNFPKIYAWQGPVPVKLSDGRPTAFFSYYILQERAKGRELFYGDLAQIYQSLNGQYTKEDAKFIVTKRQGTKEYNYLLTQFIEDYIKMNMYLESLPESQAEKLVLDAYNHYRLGKFSEPDVYGGNLLTTGQKITLIDPKHSDRQKVNSQARFDKRGNFMYTAFVNMFNFNNLPAKNVQQMFEAGSLSPSEKADFDRQLAECKKVCAAAMQKFMHIINKNLDNPKLTTDKVRSEIAKSVVDSVGKENSDKIMKDIGQLGK